MTVLVKELQGVLDGVLVDAMDVVMQIGLGQSNIGIGIGTLGSGDSQGGGSHQGEDEKADERVHLELD
jgi:hypothetical protein